MLWLQLQLQQRQLQPQQLLLPLLLLPAPLLPQQLVPQRAEVAVAVAVARQRLQPLLPGGSACPGCTLVALQGSRRRRRRRLLLLPLTCLPPLPLCWTGSEPLPPPCPPSLPSPPPLQQQLLQLQLLLLPLLPPLPPPWPSCCTPSLGTPPQPCCTCSMLLRLAAAASPPRQRALPACWLLRAWLWGRGCSGAGGRCCWRRQRGC